MSTLRILLSDNALGVRKQFTAVFSSFIVTALYYQVTDSGTGEPAILCYERAPATANHEDGGFSGVSPNTLERFHNETKTK